MPYPKSVNPYQSTGGGSKKQGLAPTTNKPSSSINSIQRNAWGDKRNYVFCMNQIGGVGRNRSQFRTNADGVNCVSTDQLIKVTMAEAEKQKIIAYDAVFSLNDINSITDPTDLLNTVNKAAAECLDLANVAKESFTKKDALPIITLYNMVKGYATTAQEYYDQYLNEVVNPMMWRETAVDDFGHSLAFLSSNKLLVGAPDIEDNDANGRVFLYTYKDTSWTQTYDISNSGGGGFGTSIAVSKDFEYYAIGAPTADISSHVYVYRDNSTNVLVDLSNGSGGGEFGHSLVFDNSKNLIIGAPNEGTGGKVYVYDYSNNSWDTQLQNTITKTNSENFGHSFAYNRANRHLAVGDNMASTSDSSGIVSIYTYDSSYNHLIDLNVNNSNNFGYALAYNADGSKLAVGTPSRIYDNRGAVYVYSITDNSYTLTDVSFEDMSGYFGSSLVYNENTGNLLIGDSFNNRVYYVNGHDISLSNISNNIDISYNFGASLAANGAYVAVGAPMADTSGNVFINIYYY